MNAPPLLMRLKVSDRERDVDLWLPLFLAWVILLVLAIALSPLTLFLIIILWPTSWGKFILLAPANLYRVLAALKDLQVDVNKKQGGRVNVYFK